jgi:hypothetical protein
MTLERVGEAIPITDATVQELQLELLRRTSFNMLNGERIARSLLAHRDLWRSVMFDRKPYWTIYYEHLSPSWLIKMRDMQYNIWNADCLFILTDVEKLPRMREVIETEEWCGDVEIYDNKDDVERALGTGREKVQSAIIVVWWD